MQCRIRKILYVIELNECFFAFLCVFAGYYDSSIWYELMTFIMFLQVYLALVAYTLRIRRLVHNEDTMVFQGSYHEVNAEVLYVINIYKGFSLNCQQVLHQILQFRAIVAYVFQIQPFTSKTVLTRLRYQCGCSCEQLLVIRRFRLVLPFGIQFLHELRQFKSICRYKHVFVPFITFILITTLYILLKLASNITRNYVQIRDCLVLDTFVHRCRHIIDQFRYKRHSI